jgi:hypothetical protein
MLDESLSLGETESPSAARDEDDFASETEEGGANGSRHVGMVLSIENIDRLVLLIWYGGSFEIRLMLLCCMKKKEQGLS